MSNRSRAASTPRAKRTLLGGAALNVRVSVAKSKGRSVLFEARPKGELPRSKPYVPGQGASRIPKAWSDTHVKRDIVNHGYSADYMLGALSVRAPIKRFVNNTQTFVALEWLGPPSLFDQCMALDVDHSKGRKPVGTLPPWKPTPIVKPAKVALDAAVLAWRQAKQLAFTEALLSF